MSKKISEITKELKERFPDLTEQYRGIFNARKIAEMLEEEDYLYMAEDGRRPTELGKQNGITEYLRTAEDGHQFYQVEYDLRGEQIVYEVLSWNYNVVLEPANTKSTASEPKITVVQEPGIENVGRRGANAIRKRHPGYIVFQEAQKRTWAFDKSTQDICGIINVEPYRNANGEYGVNFEPQDFRSFVEPELKSRRKNYIVNNGLILKIVSFLAGANAPAAPIHQPVEVAHATQPAPVGHGVRRVRLGDRLTLNSDGELINVYLAAEETGNYVPVVRAGGGIEYVHVPEVEKDGFRILSPRSPLSIALIGKKLNDTVYVNGYGYKILSINS